MQRSVPRELLWAIIFGLAVTVAGLLHALKQHPPYAPQVHAQQQTNSALKDEENAKDSAQRPAKPNEENGGKHSEQGENEGTEFWPPFLGLHLKITDSLLAAFTLGLLIFTGLLWRSTDKLWAAGEKQIRQMRAISLRQDIRTEDSIRLAREEFVATHRPKIIVRYIQGPFPDAQGRNFIWVTVVNTGVSAGIIEAFGADLAKRASVGGEWVAPGLDAEAKNVEPVTLTCGQRHVFTVTAKTTVSDDEIYREAIGLLDLCAVGEFRYGDSNGVSRHTGFFRVLDDKGANFVLSEGDSEMEYQD